MSSSVKSCATTSPLQLLAPINLFSMHGRHGLSTSVCRPKSLKVPTGQRTAAHWNSATAPSIHVSSPQISWAISVNLFPVKSRRRSTKRSLQEVGNDPVSMLLPSLISIRSGIWVLFFKKSIGSVPINLLSFKWMVMS